MKLYVKVFLFQKNLMYLSIERCTRKVCLLLIATIMELPKNEILFYKKVEVNMKIEKILKKIGLNFKIIDEINNIKIIKIPMKLNICFMMQNGNQFIMGYRQHFGNFVR